MWLLEIPNAVQVGERIVFVTAPPGADVIAEQAGGKALCVAPPEYEHLAMRRLLWQQVGLQYDDLPRDEAQEIALMLELERAHPQRFKPKKG